jgi:hypothetical protein
MKTVTVVYPVTINLDLIDDPEVKKLLENKNLSQDQVSQLRKIILDLADDILESGSVTPVIQDSDIPELID